MALQLTPYIMLDGNAKEAIGFYEKSLDAKVIFKQTFGEGTETVPEETKERLSHAVLLVGETELYVADTFQGQPNQRGNQVQICITAPDVENSTRLFDALQHGGQVITSLQKTHFSLAYGMVTDKFGVTFQIFTRR
ncbi:VOC family protein [Cohnella candidum]|uniref:VOC family protein n=1 Tax=Cohnella candidum TaxID=2674991 RepID=A0A3G3K1S5_9BACL|nr:VOC family protein [Cohnella candidum]AYQ74505.1 VOC family protein [Cohnella candidum]